MATQGNKRRRARGIAPLIVAAIIAAAIMGGATVYYLTKPATEQPLNALGTQQLLDHLIVKYVADTIYGMGQEYLVITVYTTVQSPVDIYVLSHRDGQYSVLSSHTDVKNGTTITTEYDTGPLYVLAVQNGYVDAIVVGPPSKPGEITINSEHYSDPVSLAQHVKVKVRWWDIIWDQWKGAWGLSSAMRFTGSVVFGMIPYSGILWVLWFISAVIKALSDFSVEPIMDFFYKNYEIIRGIYSLVLNAVLKIVDLITGPAT